MAGRHRYASLVALDDPLPRCSHVPHLLVRPFTSHAGSNCARTANGRTGWKYADKHSVTQTEEKGGSVLYVDIDTHHAGYTKDADYIPSIHACNTENEWMHHKEDYKAIAFHAMGVHKVYRATPTSFRVYAQFQHHVTPKEAESHEWVITYMSRPGALSCSCIQPSLLTTVCCSHP